MYTVNLGLKIIYGKWRISCVVTLKQRNISM